MNVYLISEVQNQFSEREATKVTAKNLTAAKTKASKMQCFHGTWLKIHAENGSLLASKSPRNGWFNEYQSF